MSLADWTQVSSGPAGTVSIDVTTPMVDSGSLTYVAAAGIATRAGHTFVLTSPPFSSGFTKGRIRTLARWNTGGQITVDGRKWQSGIICMMSAADVTVDGGGESCYTWAIGSGQNVATNQFEIVLMKNVDGLAGATGTHTSLHEENTLGAYPPSAGDFWPIELEWQADLAGLGGTRLIGRMGTKNSTDFGTLTDLIDIVDTTSPLLTSVGEGLCHVKGHTGTRSPGYSWSFDETTVEELT